MMTDVAGTPYWMAPEVIHSHNGYSYKADIWSFGITALELAHGRPPLSHLPPSKSLMMKLTKRFRFSDYDKSKKDHKNSKKFSKSFKEMVKSCLDQDPSKRPTAQRLLRHSFFKNCRSLEYLAKNVLQGLPSVEHRFKDAKLRRLGSINRSSEEEEDDDDDDVDDHGHGGCGDREGSFLAGERIIIKNRRISGWNLNEDGFELDPVFPNETLEDEVVKQVRFGGEKIIHHGAIEGGAESGHDSEETSHSLARVAEEEMVVVEDETAQTHNQAHDQAHIVEKAQEPAQDDDGVSGDSGGQSVAEGGSSVSSVGSNESMLSGLVTLKRSLDEQRQNVMVMIGLIGGDEALAAERNREEQMKVLIERLMLELEQEKHKNFELQMELEYCKLYISGGASVDDTSSSA